MVPLQKVQRYLVTKLDLTHQVSRMFRTQSSNKNGSDFKDTTDRIIGNYNGDVSLTFVFVALNENVSEKLHFDEIV